MSASRSSCCCRGLAVLLAVGVLVGSASTAVAQLTPEDIEALRKQGEAEGWTFEVCENEATGIPLEELCGLVVPDRWWESVVFDPCPPARDLPGSFNWCAMGGCTPVRNQGSCGSCWAFATVGPLECNIRIKDGVIVNLSEQWLVSCNQEGYGCDGGWWVHDYHQWNTDPCGGTGAVLESDFPYVAWDAPCNCPYPHEYLIDGWAFIGSGSGVPSATSIKQAIMDYGPVSVAVCVNTAFQAYGSGVFNGCSSGEVNHAVVLVGWDDNQGTNGVWIMRNSWGTSWGEGPKPPYNGGGYMRITYGCSSIGYAAAYVDYPSTAPTLVFEYPDGRPELVDPGVQTRIRVNVYPGGGTPVPGTGWLHRSTNDSSYFIVALDIVGPNQYEAVLPAGDCYDRYNWYVSVEESGGQRISDPSNAPGAVYSTLVATSVSVVLDDDFETDQGWTVEAGADQGNWERADPEEVTSSGTITQPGDDHTPDGTMCYVTGPLAGSSAGSYDVDSGPTRLISPVFNLEDADGRVSYWRWFHISVEWDDSLYVGVSNDGGASYTNVETISDREEWTFVEWKVSDYVTPTAQVRVRFSVKDSPNNSLVEALVDDFKIELIECAPPEQYTLTVNVDGNGSVVKDPDQATYNDGQVVELAANADVGWTFDHWSGDLSGSNNPDQISMDGDKTVTAHFTQDQYTLIVNIVGSGLVSKLPDQSTYTYGQVVELTANADAGWTFDHWSGDLSGSDNPDQITMDGDKTVTAHFTEDQYTLSIDVVGSGSVSKLPDQPTYTYGQVVELMANADAGWTFDHWSGDLSGSDNPDQISMDGDRTVTAHFVQEQYTLTINVDGSGSVSKLPDQPTYTYGQVVELTANADVGWTFDHWSGDLSGSNNPDQITMDGDKTVTAHFVEEDDCPEDLNGDGRVGLEDLSALLANYGETGMGPEDGDFDGDGDVDLSDLSQLLAVYGQDCPTR